MHYESSSEDYAKVRKKRAQRLSNTCGSDPLSTVRRVSLELSESKRRDGRSNSSPRRAVSSGSGRAITGPVVAEGLEPVLTIVVGGKPVGKGRPRFGNGRAFTPASTRLYEEQLKYAAQQTVGPGFVPLSGPLVVTLVSRFPIPASWSKKQRAAALALECMPVKKPDFDNLAKVVDALNLIVWNDDAQIIDGRVVKLYSETPSFTVVVRRFHSFMGLQLGDA